MNLKRAITKEVATQWNDDVDIPFVSEDTEQRWFEKGVGFAIDVSWKYVLDEAEKRSIRMVREMFAELREEE